MSDSEIEINDGSTHIMKQLSRPLFKQHACVQEALPLSDVTDGTHYAVTVNIKPNHVVNRKAWKRYSADKQRGILTRIEASLRKQAPSIHLEKLIFEECPTLGQQHFHALYTMPRLFVAEMQTFWERHSGNLPDTKVPWRTVVIKEVFNTSGWMDYITKEYQFN